MYLPNEFDWGYTDSDVITPEKSFITLATEDKLSEDEMSEDKISVDKLSENEMSVDKMSSY
jgi:hypothetical protein